MATITGTTGNDTLIGTAAADTINGGVGWDTLQGGDGNDTLDGGAGNDVLNGGAGQDTYTFGRGDGQDIIWAEYQGTSPGAAARLETLVFKAGVTADQVRGRMDGADLVLSIIGTLDSVRIGGFFNANDPQNPSNPIQQVKFADGTVWGLTELVTVGLAGTDRSDSYGGTSGDDTMGGAAGNDTLYGGGGDDVLDGGIGNDILAGNFGNDIYIFGRGSGQDTISSEGDYTGGVRLDKIVLKAGITPDQVVGHFDGYDLILEIIGTTDSVRISGFYSSSNPNSDYNPIQQVDFANGVTWGLADLVRVGLAGTANADGAEGTSGSDVFAGSAGDDTQIGGAGNDTLEGGLGNDSLAGGVGKDVYLFGLGDGQDTISSEQDYTGLARLDTLQFKAGISPSQVSARFDGWDLILSINGTEDSVRIQSWGTEYYGIDSSNPIQQVKFSDGTVWNLAKLFTVASAATPGNDTLYGPSGADIFDAGPGNDYLRGGDGNDTYLFGIGDGQDIIAADYDISANRLETLQLKNGIQPSQVGVRFEGNDLILSLVGGLDSVRIQSFYNGESINTNNPVQQVKFSNGVIWGKDQLIQMAAADEIYGSSWDDTIDAGSGNDFITGNGGDDIVLFGGGDGQDTISGAVVRFKQGISPDEINLTTVSTNFGYLIQAALKGSADSVEFSLWNSSYIFESYLSFANGPTWNRDEIIRRILLGTVDNDLLMGTDLSDTINGGVGWDTLRGGDGNDALDGGAGNDVINGGAGQDTYTFGRGDGQDTIEADYQNPIPGAARPETLVFKAGVTADQVRGRAEGTDLVLSIIDTLDSVRIGGFFIANDPQNASNPIQQVKFADGTVWGLTELVTVGLAGTDRSDSYTGTSGDDTMGGGAGNDTLYGGYGDDVLNGGSGNDSLAGNFGNDVYLFGRGSGQDTIYSEGDYTGGVRLDKIVFKAGVTPDQVAGHFDGNDLILEIIDTTDSVRISGFYYDTRPNGDYNPIQQVDFSNGVTWGLADLVKVGLAGTANADRAEGTSGSDVFAGSAGDDTQIGGSGNDTLEGGLGNDSLAGGVGKDVYLFGLGDGQDTIGAELDYTGLARLDTLQFKAGISLSQVSGRLEGSDLILSINGTEDSVRIQSWYYGNDPSNSYNPIQQVKFNDGTVWNLAKLFTVASAATPGNDTVNGTSGADIFDTGLGNDYLVGGAGNDTYLFGSGDGQDTIAAEYDDSVSRLNTLQFKADITPLQVSGRQDGTDLILSLNAQDSIRIQYFFWNNDSTNFYNPIQQAKFSGGTTWSLTDLVTVGLAGTAGDDSYTGTVANDTMGGGAGNDTLSGYGGNDVLSGGAGNDSLLGGLGDDVYLFGGGDGQDTIGAEYAEGSRQETLQFKAGITPSQVSGRQDGTDLILSLNAQDSIRIQYFFWNNDSTNFYNPIQQAKFSGGTTWSLTDLVTVGLAGTAGDDSYTGTVANDTMGGGAGNDTLSSGDGNDVLSGGAGNDYLLGGAGNDTYLFGTGDGQDTIGSEYAEGSRQDTLQFKAGITPSQVSGRQDGSDLILSLNTQDSVRIQNFFYNNDPTNPYNPIQRVQFQSSSEVWNLAKLVDLSTLSIIKGTAANEKLDGTSRSDQIFGFAGNDTLTGLAGNDTLDGGSGADSMTGGLGDDVYFVDDAKDMVVEKVGEGSDTVLASINYILPATVENLTLTGMAAINATGNDLANLLIGNDAANTLDGKTGADTMLGGAGNDIYVVDNTGDQVTEMAGQGVDTVNASVSFTLGNFVENLILTGTTNIDGAGSAQANSLTGNTGNNVLDGGAGADTMAGGKGNDTYFVDTVLDTITEKANEGTDAVRSYVAYTLGANLETLQLLGNAHSGTGNALANLIVGAGGADTLLGLDGNDTLNDGDGDDVVSSVVDRLEGGKGDDTYYVHAGDQVIEVDVAGKDTGGKDSVFSWDDFMLGANLENLTLKPSTHAIKAIGNSLANTLTGNDNDNTLDGGLGNDTLIGGKGNDTYVVNDARDKVTENKAEGTDTVFASVSHTLAVNVENLVLLETAPKGSKGFGNADANRLTGNAQDNTLDGSAGNDTLIGGGGIDTLTGGAGNDVLIGGVGVDVLSGGVGDDWFYFDKRYYTNETIKDFSKVKGNTDKLVFDATEYGNLALGLLDNSNFVKASGKPVATGTTAQFLYDGSTGTLYFDADGALTTASAVQVATLSNKAVLAASDILIVGADPF